MTNTRRTAWGLGFLVCLVASACVGDDPYSLTAVREHVPLSTVATVTPTFLFGAATAPYQVEGGLDALTDWGRAGTARRSTPRNQPCGEGRSDDDRLCLVCGCKGAGTATDSWNRFDDDLAALRRLGANAYRLGLEWARLQPVDGGDFDPAVVTKYRAMLQALRASGIEPVVTVFHFTLPVWLSDGLGPAETVIESSTFPARAAAHAARVAGAFGDLVDVWVTVNEPTILASEVFLAKEWPPAQDDARVSGDGPVRMARAVRNLLEAHAQMAAAIRQHDVTSARGASFPSATLGLAHHHRPQRPATLSTLDADLSSALSYLAGDGVLDALTTGRLDTRVLPFQHLLPESEETIPGLVPPDFLGINFYTAPDATLGVPLAGECATGTTGGPMVETGPAPLNALAWPVVPRRFEDALVAMRRYAIPVLITENGTTTDDESARDWFLRAHLLALDRAVARGANVMGYLHWSLVDNFEWHQGFDSKAHFGLFRVDVPGGDLTRVPRCAVNAFRSGARTLGLVPQDADVAAGPAGTRCDALDPTVLFAPGCR